MKDDIRISVYEGQEYEIGKLRKLLEPYGIGINIIQRGNERIKWQSMSFSYDVKELESKRTRNAGRKKIQTDGIYTVGMIRDLKKSMKGEDLARMLGISRKTLYRRLQEIENAADDEPFI